MKPRTKFLIGVILIVMIAILGRKIIDATNAQSATQASGEMNINELAIELEAYVQDTMKQNDIPGVSMVLVQDGQVVYLQGLGVRDLMTQEPVTPDTLMGIGSATKPMTAVMIGTLVDAGILSWDTLVTEILPAFSLSDPEITSQTTIAHTLCMCTGVPRRMEEISVQYTELSPEDIIASLAEIPLSGQFERSFNYSTRMVAAGGYIASIAAGGAYGDLNTAYARVMQDRIFDPLGMTTSTFSIQAAVESGNYATPYYSGLAGVHATPPEVEGVFTPIAPGGGLWSNANEMGKYLIMLLNNGMADNGQQIIAPQTLETLWTPQVYIDSHNQYGLGWHIEDYYGLTVVHHPGGTVGFASELVIIPELKVGFALLTNRLDMIAPIGRMATYRLLELLTGREHTYDQEIAQTQRDTKKQVVGLSVMTQKTISPDELAPFLGTYHNVILGDFELVIHEDRTAWVDVGEYEIPARPLRTNPNEFILYESIFIGKTLKLEMEANGNPQMTLTGDEASYQFELVRDQD